MYKIIFSVNNNEEVWTLPHCPPDFPIPQPEQHHETYEGLSRDYRRIGTLGLRHMGGRHCFRCTATPSCRLSVCGWLGVSISSTGGATEGAVPADRARQ
ncbi:MAG: hypothetical protein ACLSF2_10465 [Butyricicoccus sp.]